MTALASRAYRSSAYTLSSSTMTFHSPPSPPAALGVPPEHRSGGQMERRDRVDDLRAGSGAGRNLRDTLDRVDVHAVFVDRYGGDDASCASHEMRRAAKRRLFDDDPVAWTDERVCDQREALCGALGQDQVLGVDSGSLSGDDPLGKLLAEPRMAEQHVRFIAAGSKYSRASGPPDANTSAADSRGPRSGTSRAPRAPGRSCISPVQEVSGTLGGRRG